MQRKNPNVFLLAGLIVGLVLPLATTESYLRWFPAKETYPYLGDKSPLTGAYVVHDKFGITYRSWDDMMEENKKNMEAYSAVRADGRPLWLLYGASFARYLAKDCSEVVLDHRSAVLHKHGVDLPLQMAHLEMLLGDGLKPEHVFFVMLALEGISLGEHPLGSRQINKNGAVVYVPRPAPWPLDWFVKNTRIGLTLWVRTRQALIHPRFKGRHLYRSVDKGILDDFRRLYGDLSEVTRSSGVKVSVILIPRYGQIMKHQGFGFQNDLTPMLEKLGFDVIDPKEAFLKDEAPARLFIPDGHLSKAGDAIIIEMMQKRKGTSSGAARS
jgi:hypothetical protein